jgi:hypothetical protein
VTADPAIPGSAADELPFRRASGAEGHRFESCRARQPSLTLANQSRELRLASHAKAQALDPERTAPSRCESKGRARQPSLTLANQSRELRLASHAKAQALDPERTAPSRCESKGRARHLPPAISNTSSPIARGLRYSRGVSCCEATASRPSTEGSTASGLARTLGVRPWHARQRPPNRGRLRAAAARSDPRS